MSFLVSVRLSLASYFILLGARIVLLIEASSSSVLLPLFGMKKLLNFVFIHNFGQFVT